MVIFFIWWVALRPWNDGPRPKPLIVLTRMTVGWPLCWVGGLVRRVDLAVVVTAARSRQMSSSDRSATICSVRGSRPKKWSRMKPPSLAR